MITFDVGNHLKKCKITSLNKCLPKVHVNNISVTDTC